MRGLLFLFPFLFLVPSVAVAQAPSSNMIHVVDAKFISNRTEIQPSGLVVVMSFADKDGTLRAHSLTADDGTFDVRLSAPADATDFKEANFTAPARPGEYPFHDAESSARGMLVVVATPGYQPPRAAPGAPLALALALALALRRPKS